jgi:MFS transporter, DHA2 family, multidrug resistance protein
MAMALYSMRVMLAPTMGPIVGGWLVDNWGWRWIFYINVPFAISGLLMVSSFVHDLTCGADCSESTGLALAC